MADYIVEMNVGDLKESPINSEIYHFVQKEHDELVESINQNGLLDPLVIDKNNFVISGHRRLQAIKDIGFETVDCRLSFFENNVIAIIELNKYRKKTEGDIRREISILQKEFKNVITKESPKGRTTPSKNRTIIEISKRLGTNTTKIKEILSIEKHEPSLLDDVDLGKISHSRAYQIVREKYILPKGYKTGKVDMKSFKQHMMKLLKKYNPPKEVVMEVIDSKYPKVKKKMNKKQLETDFKMKKIKQYSDELHDKVISKEVTLLEAFNEMMSSVNETAKYISKGTRHKDKK